MNIILLIGALFGLTSVMMAAYIDHSFASILTGKSLSSVLTAVRYHQLYAILLCAIGLSLSFQFHTKTKAWLKRSAFVFIMGILCFCTSIYLSSLFHITGILYLTPVGGVLFMVGWVFLLFAAISQPNSA